MHEQLRAASPGQERCDLDSAFHSIQPAATG